MFGSFAQLQVIRLPPTQRAYSTTPPTLLLHHFAP